MEDKAVVLVKYELFYEGADARVGKVDRVGVVLDSLSDPEVAAIAFRDAVHERRRVRDLSHCSAANLRISPESNPDDDMQDDDFLRFILDGAPEKVRVTAPPFHKSASSAPSSAPASHFMGTSRNRSSTSGGRSADFPVMGGSTLGIPGAASAPPSRRESASSVKRGESDSMVVFVKTGDATFPVEVERSATADTVKARIKEQEQIPLDQQRLIFGGMELEASRPLLEYNIQQGSEIQLVLTLGSGAS